MKFALAFLVCLITDTDAGTTQYYSDCGDTSYYGPSGNISSPNYPYYYYNSLYCNYYVYASTGSSLSFIFESFNTEQFADFVTIRCPTNSSLPSIQFSGWSLPDPVSLPWCSQGSVQFITNSYYVYSGFSLDYYVSDGGCGNTLYKDYYGYVTSPNYPSYYGYYQNCYNIIWAPQSSTFHLYFQDFNLDSCCSCDWLEISCLDNPASYPVRYCQYYSGYSHYVYGCTQVLLLFITDGSYNYYGFNIQYNVYPDGGVTGGGTTRPEEVTTGNPACGESSYFGSYGVIRSPNYPDYYGNYLYCDYYIYASTGSSLSFFFKSFHVDKSDILTITCPPNSNIPPQEFSGHSLPDPVSMPVCSQGRVNFRTDYTNVSSGFSLEYYVSDGGCGNTVFIGSNGHVNSPQWPDYYGYNQNCSNIIWASQQSTFQLQFRSFNLQSNCSCDWLEISCLDNSEFSPYRYCGNYNSHELLIYRCSQVLLWFHSDGSGNYPGFNIEYTVYPDGACGETSYTVPSGVISSPNYPGDYSNLLYCDYTIYASTGSSLSFIFKSLDVQNGEDFVTISCPANSSYPKSEYTGTYVPGPLSISACSQGLVNFHTDESVVSSGFSLDYYVNSGGCGNTMYYSSYGYVTSPNYPNNYGYSQNCYNIIFPGAGGSYFYLNFHSFILQSCCSCDWLEVSCLDNSAYGPTRYCGTYAPFDTYIYNCSQVLLWFHSDASSNDQGFNMEYGFYTTADDSKEPNNGTSNAAEEMPSNGMQGAPQKVHSNGMQGAPQKVPSNGMQGAPQKVPSNGMQGAPEKVPINGKVDTVEKVPINQKPNGEERMKGK